MAISLEGRFFAGLGLLDQGIEHMVLVADGAGLTLFTGSGRNGGLASFTLNPTGGASVADTQVFHGDWTTGVSDSFALVSAPGGGLEAVIGSTQTGMISAYSAATDGQIGALSTYGGFGQGTRPVSIGESGAGGLAFAGHDGTLGYAARGGSGDLTTWVEIADDDTMHVDHVSAVETAMVNGADVLIVGDAGEDGVTTFVLTGGVPIMADSAGPADGIGVMDPADIAVVDVLGQSFVIVGSAQGQNGALTVFWLGPDGALTRTDHITDNQHTRFGGLTTIATVEVDGRQYVASGGADDGVSLFVLLPGGQLQFLDVIENNWVDGGPGQVALANISALAAGRLNDQIRIIAASQEEAGLTDLSWSVANQGIQAQAGTGGDTLSGNSGHDILVGGAGDDTLTGGAGDDIIVDGAGADILTGGDGADLFVLRDDDAEDIIMDFDAGQDRLDLSSWPFFYDPSQLSILPNANGAEILFRGVRTILRSKDGGPINAADVRAAVARTPDRAMDLSGYVFPEDPEDPDDPGDDGDGSGDEGGDGDDGETDDGDTDDGDETGGGGGSGGTGPDTVQLDPGGDSYIHGTDAAVVVLGGTGNDYVETGGGDDHISGGAGNDQLGGQGGNDTISGGDGNDTIWAAAGDDEAYGEAGDDSIFGGSGNDLLEGGAGEDFLDGSTGNDILRGGPGHDVLHGGPGNDVLEGGAGDDTLRGDTGDDILRGGEGEDMLFGGRGNDTLEGGPGDDVLFGNHQQDTLIGGPGDDMIFGQKDHDVLEGGDGNDQLFGGRRGDTLFGGDGDDTLWGQNHADTLWGEAGNDTLYGNKGPDTLMGGEGNDTLRGGRGHDTLYAGPGDDWLHGGRGRDTFVFYPIDGTNRIYQFEDRDTLILRDINRADVSLVTSGSDMIIDWGIGSVTLEGYGGSGFSLNDIDFLA